MAKTIGKGAWIVTVKGIIAILFGLLALFYPIRTIEFIAEVFGFVLIFTGLVLCIGSVFHTKYNKNWKLWILEGIVDLILGIIIVSIPVLAVTTYVLLIGIWAILMGLWRIYQAIKFKPQRGILLFGGIISLIFGILVIINPFAWTAAIVIVLGIYAIIFGLSVTFRSLS